MTTEIYCRVGTAYSDLFDFFFVRIISNNSELHVQYNNVYILLLVQKSCTTWDVQNLSTGAGFLPSTICIFLHIFLLDGPTSTKEKKGQ